MFNTTIPFSRLLNGIFSLAWILPLYMFILDKSFEEILSKLVLYKDISIYIISFLAILSYPIGIVISMISYYVTDLFIYQIFIYRKPDFDKIGHSERVRKLSIDSPDRLNEKMKVLTQELSILGTCGTNFIIITIILFLHLKFNAIVFFSLVFSIIFFISVIHKYKSWYFYVKKNYNPIVIK